MARIIDQRTDLDKTVKVFDTFYEFELNINGNEYDIVNGYFTSIVKSKNIANNFTAVLFRIAQETGISAMTLLDNIKGSTAIDMNKVMAYYMNSFKSKTTLYGISDIPVPNQTVARNIVL